MKQVAECERLPCGPMRELARCMLRDAAIWFEDPANRAKFEAWLEERERRKAEEA